MLVPPGRVSLTSRPPGRWPETRKSWLPRTTLSRPPGRGLDARSHQDITVNQLAADLRISVRNLNRRFKLATGTTPAGYHKRRRLEEAKSLLKNSNAPLGDLSWRLGFSDPAQFSRWFKGMCHLTPSRYRQASRGKLFTHTL